MRTKALAALAASAALAAGCGDDEQAAQEKRKPDETSGPVTTLRLEVKTKPGFILFDRRRLEAPAGRIVLELINGQSIGHNLRVQTGKRCCFKPGSKDVGGTQTISNGQARAELNLPPGDYGYRGSLGGHWQRGQRGRLVVRG